VIVLEKTQTRFFCRLSNNEELIEYEGKLEEKKDSSWITLTKYLAKTELWIVDFGLIIDGKKIRMPDGKYKCFKRVETIMGKGYLVYVIAESEIDGNII